MGVMLVREVFVKIRGGGGYPTINGDKDSVKGRQDCKTVRAIRVS